MIAILDQSPTGYQVPEGQAVGPLQPVSLKLKARARGDGVELGPASVWSLWYLPIVQAIIMAPAVPFMFWGVQYREPIGIAIGCIFIGIAIVFGLVVLGYNRKLRRRGPFIRINAGQVHVAGRSFPRGRLHSIEHVTVVGYAKLPPALSACGLQVVVVEQTPGGFRHTLAAELPHRFGRVDRQIQRFADLASVPLVACTVSVSSSLELWRCVRCGYDLSGLASARCPECGANGRRGLRQEVPSELGFVPPLPKGGRIQMRLVSSGGSTLLVIDRWGELLPAAAMLIVPMVAAVPVAGLVIRLSNWSGIPGRTAAIVVAGVGLIVVECFVVRDVLRGLRRAPRGTLFTIEPDGTVRLPTTAFHRGAVDSVKQIGVRVPLFDRAGKQVGTAMLTCLALARRLPDGRLAYETIHPNVHPSNFVALALAERLGVPLDREEMDAPTTGDWAT